MGRLENKKLPQANTPAHSHWHDCALQTPSSPSRKWTVKVLLVSRNKKFPGLSTDHFLHSSAYTKQKWFPVLVLQTILPTTTSCSSLVQQKFSFLKIVWSCKSCTLSLGQAILAGTSSLFWRMVFGPDQAAL